MAPSEGATAFLVACLPAFALPASAGAVGIHNGRVVGQLKKRPSAVARQAAPLIAPQDVCPGQEDLDAPPAAQEQAMRCMTDYARSHAGLNVLSDAEALDVSASDKSGDILNCDDFSHFACGREFTYWIRDTGYMSTPCWHVGENLAWGTGEFGSVRSIFIAWMHSPEHRKNILGEYRQLGVSMEVGTLGFQSGAHIWTQHFGTQCEAAATPESPAQETSVAEAPQEAPVESPAQETPAQESPAPEAPAPQP